MSAWVVSYEHIAQMVKVAKEGPVDRVAPWWGPTWYVDTPDGRLTHKAEDYAPDALMLMLATECVASVKHRYQEDDEALPGPTDRYWLRPIRYQRPTSHARTVEALKIIDCYASQSCEHPEWEASEARAFCRALRESLISSIPGWDQAPWGWDAP
jgi:hypothetical protein